jgi:hypothetical protein
VKNPPLTSPRFEPYGKVIVEACWPGLWTVAIPCVLGPVKIQLSVDPQASWVLRDSRRCSAAGIYETAAEAFLPTAPLGALIAKVGGGSADCPPPSGTAILEGAGRKVAVGTFAVLDVKESESGALFLTMNDRLSGFAAHGGHLHVAIAVAIG